MKYKKLNEDSHHHLSNALLNELNKKLNEKLLDKLNYHVDTDLYDISIEIHNKLNEK